MTEQLREFYTDAVIQTLADEVRGAGKREELALSRVGDVVRQREALQRAFRESRDVEDAGAVIMLELADLVEAEKRTRGKLEKLRRERSVAVGRLTRAQKISRWLR